MIVYDDGVVVLVAVVLVLVVLVVAGGRDVAGDVGVCIYVCYRQTWKSGTNTRGLV